MRTHDGAVDHRVFVVRIGREVLKEAGFDPGKLILLVEDDASIRNIITEVLSDEGYAVATAAASWRGNRRETIWETPSWPMVTP